ncbi:MAG: hypothetical protein PVH63_03530 [Balneolaceae bacterium]|jgi:hypothetical protein
MDIFKLFFDHDLRLDTLAPRNSRNIENYDEDRLAAFMRPDPTYSKFYFTGTRLEEEQFGINCLSKGEEVINQLGRVFNNHTINTAKGLSKSLSEAFSAAGIGDALIISNKPITVDFTELKLNEESNVGHKKEKVREILETGAYVLYKEKAHNGFDLHLFSRENIYPSLFKYLKPLIDEEFRFFSINSKRMRSERHFYFETWMLSKPPHGAEEIFPGTEL